METNISVFNGFHRIECDLSTLQTDRHSTHHVVERLGGESDEFKIYNFCGFRGRKLVLIMRSAVKVPSEHTFFSVDHF